jgi:eukaryotic-like serine/threonine-protein kinase
LNERDAATLNALLSDALELPSEQRAAWLAALVQQFEPLKPRLRSLLARGNTDDQRRLTTLPKAAGSVPPSTRGRTTRRPWAVIGHYRLLRSLGSGGMGVVWLARDQRAVDERLVALKFARGHADPAGLAGRLAREQRLLAALEHPNIARLYDSGQSADGQLYLVLEYIAGSPLDRHCAERATTLAQRFALFVQIADALTHAHAQQIVHRDLKPSNVLVTDHGETRLLDFGVAKLLGEPSASRSQLSVLWGRPVTPAYASPEQLSGEAVTFASDIYSLGVMLYELITGARPYTYKRGSNRALRDAILSVAPPPPSAVVADGGARALLQGGIDATLLRALHKQPAQRQPSMSVLAAEIEQHARTLSRLA